MNIVVLTGAGISAESGIATFRDSNGLWEGHDVMEVASPEGWSKNRELVLEFYNQRRVQAQSAEPNQAHLLLAELEKDHDVTVITQNVDDLHEQAGSSKVIHLHGELFKSQSTVDPTLVYEMDSPYLKIGDKCEKGSQLRPYIVWFGEAVPMIEKAMGIVSQAELFVVIGTSLVVYPAASLIDYVPRGIHTYIIDPKSVELLENPELHFIVEKASTGVNKLITLIKEKRINTN